MTINLAHTIESVRNKLPSIKDGSANIRVRTDCMEAVCRMALQSFLLFVELLEDPNPVIQETAIECILAIDSEVGWAQLRKKQAQTNHPIIQKMLDEVLEYKGSEP